VEPEPWQGSGDVTAMARANAFLVADAERESWDTGDAIRVLQR
jgi:molybdopterin biosynthesis enzyme